jgi:protein-S-isoprenylcysteine O-methyltransferase Ste14
VRFVKIQGMNIRKIIYLLLEAVIVSIIFVGIPLGLVYVNKALDLPVYSNIYFKIIGIVLIVASLSEAVYSTGWHLMTGRMTPVPVIEQPKKIIDRGFYKYCRNPMYLSWVVMYVGVFLVFGQVLLLLFPVVAFIIFHILVVKIEEPELVRIFGKEYENYIKKVPRWIPKI